jgi:hypothetical protein
LRIDVAAIKACMGIVALCWVTAPIAAPTAVAGSAGTAASAGTHPVQRAGTALPAIRLLESQPALAGTCGGNAFVVNTFINVTALASANVQLSAPGVGTIEEFADETGKNIGPYDADYPMFQILAFGGGLAPNTPITVTITTYAGSNLTGATTFVSVLEFNCTTGQVISALPSQSGPIAVPTLSPLALTATALLVLLGAGMLGGPAALRRARR